MYNFVFHILNSTEFDLEQSWLISDSDLPYLWSQPFNSFWLKPEVNNPLPLLSLLPLLTTIVFSFYLGSNFYLFVFKNHVFIWFYYYFNVTWCVCLGVTKSLWVFLDLSLWARVEIQNKLHKIIFPPSEQCRMKLVSNTNGCKIHVFSIKNNDFDCNYNSNYIYNIWLYYTCNYIIIFYMFRGSTSCWLNLFNFIFDIVNKYNEMITILLFITITIYLYYFY